MNRMIRIQPMSAPMSARTSALPSTKTNATPNGTLLDWAEMYPQVTFKQNPPDVIELIKLDMGIVFSVLRKLEREGPCDGVALLRLHS